MTVKQFNATKWMVEVQGCGAVFVGKEEDCHEYVAEQLARKQRFAHENMTERADFMSYQR